MTGAIDFWSQKIFIDDDTLVNGVDYRFLYYSSFDSAGAYKDKSNADLIREDTSKRIFIVKRSNSILDTFEILLYDFGIAVGDTVEFSHEWMYGKPVPHILKKIDTIIISGVTRRRYIFNDYGSFVSDWIEGIGSLAAGFRGPYIKIFESGEFLACYYDSSIY